MNSGALTYVGKSVAAEMRGQALKRPGFVRPQVEPGGHAVHRVNHASELRDEEHVHHARRGKLELQRHACGNGERIDACDLLVGIDEQPFPVERHRLNRLGRRGSFDRLGRVELMGADPCHAAKKDDGECRHRLDDEFDATRILPVGPVNRRTRKLNR